MIHPTRAAFSEDLAEAERDMTITMELARHRKAGALSQAQVAGLPDMKNLRLLGSEAALTWQSTSQVRPD